ncbi:hypothetical protein BDP55DRAFT_650058, partial [Colletotrichum godetiae]
MKKKFGMQRWWWVVWWVGTSHQSPLGCATFSGAYEYITHCRATRIKGRRDFEERTMTKATERGARATWRGGGTQTLRDFCAFPAAGCLEIQLVQPTCLHEHLQVCRQRRRKTGREHQQRGEG